MLGDRGISVVELEDGEATKTLENYATIIDRLVEQRMARDSMIIALGGGVVGDIAGFAAATYQRGIDFIQVPTTLLAQVDSAVGGKTAVNHPGGKNLIGAFHQPRLVLSDTDTLHTLPDRELSAGLAEVVQSGLLWDADLFEWLESASQALIARDSSRLDHAIRRSCEIKAQVVAGDEREKGQRALLNLGHTFAHAVEQCAGYGNWLHGEAVAAGLVMAARFSERLGRLTERDVERIRTLLVRMRLPVDPPSADPREFLASMSRDKKVAKGRIRLVLNRGIGRAELVADYPEHELVDMLRESFIR
jgi:3-dehydroquinate synthase